MLCVCTRTGRSVNACLGAQVRATRSNSGWGKCAPCRPRMSERAPPKGKMAMLRCLRCRCQQILSMGCGSLYCCVDDELGVQGAVSSRLERMPSEQTCGTIQRGED